jgi:hypothetical protein
MKLKKRKELITRVDYSETIVHSRIDHFEADLIGGNIIIQSGPEGQASISVQWKEEEKVCSFGIFWIDGNTIRLKSKSFRSFIGQKHPYIIEVTLPRATTVTVKMMAGVLYLENIHADVTASLKAGEILGNVSGKNNIISLWAGDVQLSFDTIERNSHITVTCSLGDVRLHFPSGTLTDTNSEYRYNGSIENTKGAHISAHSTFGGVAVEEEI